MDINQQVQNLTLAIYTLADAMDAGTDSKERVLTQLDAFDVAVSSAQSAELAEIKRFMALTSGALRRYHTHGRPSDRKLAERNGAKATKEIQRFLRALKRAEAQLGKQE